MIFTEYGGPWLVFTYFPGTEIQSADNITLMCNKIRQEMKKLKIMDTKHVTDNCNVMNAARDGYMEFTGNLAYGCGVHAYNIVNKYVWQLAAYSEIQQKVEFV